VISEITMPKLSDSMLEGTIISWLKRDGEPVARDEDLVEIETDKATMTYASEFEGVLQILAADGTTHPVGTVIAQVVPRAAAAAPIEANGGEATGVGLGVSGSTGSGGGSDPTGTGRGIARAEINGESAPAPRIVAALRSSARATPLARRAADAHGVDLELLRGTGPGGRITRADVLSAVGDAAPAVAAAAPAVAGPADKVPSPPRIEDRGDTIERPNRVQRLIAARMAEANATVPQFGLQTEVTMDGAIALRSELKALTDVDTVPSYNDLVIKACALALVRHPRVNASYHEDRFELHGRVNVGFAVAADDALIVPTVSDADRKSLTVIAHETRRLAARVRSGEITPPELSGATFTVSNLGMFGMTAIRPIVNPPQVAILGVGAMRAVLTRVEGLIADRTVMTLTLTSDHRILYGAHSARFLADVKALLESPLRLVL
jgi:pyruvate dehydrogenase E2 component (dihydrolipoamide acetyltransferase)